MKNQYLCERMTFMKKMKKFMGGRVLLLTGTIAPKNINVAETILVDAEDRLHQYEQAIDNYIRHTCLSKIVFVENSGYMFDVAKFDVLAKQYNKQFEYIYVDIPNYKTEKNEKQYGELILIWEGIQRSLLIKDEDVVYKCTGRVFCSNVDQIVNDEKCFGVIAKNRSNQVLTSFIKIYKPDFLSYFSDTMEINFNIEKTYYQNIKDNHIETECFSQYPQLHGIHGSSNKPYQLSFIGVFQK